MPVFIDHLDNFTSTKTSFLEKMPRDLALHHFKKDDNIVNDFSQDIFFDIIQSQTKYAGGSLWMPLKYLI